MNKGCGRNIEQIKLKHQLEYAPLTLSESITLVRALVAESACAVPTPTEEERTMEKQYDYPVWGTQGGGLVRRSGSVYIFVEKPECPGLNVGDAMPKEWDIAPANSQAWEEINEDEMDEFGST